MTDDRHPRIKACDGAVAAVLADLDPENEDAGTVILCVDQDLQLDIMLGVGGPTRWVRLVCSIDAADLWQRLAESGELSVKYAEYHSTAAEDDIPRGGWDLTSDDAAAIGEALGIGW